jgi:hypothetical protein
VVLSAADNYNLNHVVIKTFGDKTITQTSIWVLLTQNKIFPELPAISEVKMKEEEIVHRVVMWTDDFSNLFSVMKRR